MDVHLYFVSKTTPFPVDPPVVTEHPKSQSIPTGGETIFKIEARGDDLQFQWLKNGSNLKNDSTYSGTDTNTLRIQHVKKRDGRRYRCLVRNEVKKDGVLSEKAQLSVCKFTFIYCVNAVETIVHKSMTCIIFLSCEK